MCHGSQLVHSDKLVRMLAQVRDDDQHGIFEHLSAVTYLILIFVDS